MHHVFRRLRPIYSCSILAILVVTGTSFRSLRPLDSDKSLSPVQVQRLGTEFSYEIKPLEIYENGKGSMTSMASPN